MQPGMEDRHGLAAAPSCSLVRSQLHRILASDIFTRSERMSAFLRFVVEQTLDGRGGNLKEQVLGSELYGKGPEFDGAVDTIVRVEARRLRDKLREYYAEFPWDPILISLPKGAYIPLFDENKTAIASVASLPTKPEAVRVPRGLPWRRIAATSSLAALLGSVLTWVALHERPEATANLVKIASFQGLKEGLSLSPDGRFIAFSSRGPEDTGPPDIDRKSTRLNSSHL